VTALLVGGGVTLAVAIMLFLSGRTAVNAWQQARRDAVDAEKARGLAERTGTELAARNLELSTSKAELVAANAQHASVVSGLHDEIDRLEKWRKQHESPGERLADDGKGVA
jgi:hypothetical protein